MSIPYALRKFLLARAAHATAVAEVSRLGREMGIAFNELVAAAAVADPDVAAVVDALKKSAKETR